MSSTHPIPTSPAGRTTRRRDALRKVGRVVAGVVALLLLTVAGALGASEWRARKHYVVPEHLFTVPTDSAAASRGAHLAQIRFCADCHGADLAGRVMIDEPAVGRIASANLTNGRPGGALTDADWERAVRHGVRRDGSPLVFMPSHEFAELADDDLGAIVAHARRLPASSSATPATTAGPVLRALDLAGQVQLHAAALVDHDRPHRARFDAEPTVAYGRYLASTCRGCHGATLSGGPVPGAPPEWKPAANLTPAGLGHYQEADFARVLRTGRRPDGSAVDSIMPWRYTQALDDVEVRALWDFLRSVPPRAYGNR